MELCDKDRPHFSPFAPFFFFVCVLNFSLSGFPIIQPTGWNKASLSADASEENDGYSSGEDPMNSDPEDEVGKKLVSLRMKNYYRSVFLFLF